MLSNFNEYNQYIIFSYLTIGINIVTGFILFPLIIKHLGVEALGVFGIFFSLKSILDIGISGSSSSITKNLMKYKYLRNTIFTFSLFFNTLYGLLGLLFFVLYGLYFKEDYFVVSLYFGLFVFINFATNTFYEMMISSSKQHRVASFRLMLQLFFFLFTVPLFYILEDKSLDYIFLGLFLSSIIVFFIVYISFKNNFQIYISRQRINYTLIKRLLFNDGRSFFFNTMSIVFLLQIDLLLINYLYGNKSAGIYLILFKIPNTMIMLGWKLSEPFKVIVVEKIKENKCNELYKEFLILEKKIFYISFLSSGLYIIFGEYILELWVGKENVPHIVFMYIVSAVVILLTTMQELYSSINYYTKDISSVTLLNMIQILIKIIFVIFLFNQFQELAPMVGWMIVLSFLILIYRKNSLKILGENK